MIKKLVLLFSILLAALTASAQLPVGGWTIHTPFNGISRVAETKGSTYYLSAGSLFAIDKSTGEVRSLNVSNLLNSSGVAGIYPHPDGSYLLVVYSDCNMDKLYDDGSVVNISDIKDALLTGIPTINHVGFGQDRIFVACSFGLVIIDDKRNETIETLFTPLPVTYAWGVGDDLIIHYDKLLRGCPQSTRLTSLDQIPVLRSNQYNIFNGLPVGGKQLVLALGSASNPQLAVAEFNVANSSCTIQSPKYGNNKISGVTQIFPVGDKVAAMNASRLFTFDGTSDPMAPESVAIPAVISGNQLSALKGWDELWGGNNDGIISFDMSDPANPVQNGERYGKTDFSVAHCNNIRLQPDGSLWFSRKFWEYGFASGYPTLTSADRGLLVSSYTRADGFKDILPEKLANDSKQKALRPGVVAQVPGKPGSMLVPTWDYGLLYFPSPDADYIVIDDTNSPMSKMDNNNGDIANYGYRVEWADVDPYGNLWVMQESVFTRDHIFVLPAEKFNSGDFTKSDWISYNRSFQLSRGSFAIPLTHSGRWVFTGYYWTGNLSFFDFRGTADPSDDVRINVASFVDQDNKTLSIYHTPSLLEDKKGRLWVGTNNGVYEITDPSKVSTDVATVNHLKVPRNDGTGLADYLLDAQQVTAMACDASNRKWLGTLASGVYLVSEDGDQIIEHFTTENSMLPSNKIFAIACDPNSSSVFFATDEGVAEYNSTSAPPSQDLSDVYAFPNPVRPDYTGWITITGLMDNTLVKIADSAGNVFFQGRSEGGTLIWDGCNANGDRVKTGVYFVFASSGTEGTSSDGCVTKIMVIN